jgi:hypothetical protein
VATGSEPIASRGAKDRKKNMKHHAYCPSNREHREYSIFEIFSQTAI